MSSLLLGLVGGSSLGPLLSPVLLVALAVASIVWLYPRIARGGPYDMKTFMRIPGPPPLPVVGNALALNVPNEDFLKVLMRLCGEHGPVMRFFLAHRPYIILTGAQAFEDVLSSPKFLSKGPGYRFLHDWLGLGLLTSDGQKWFTRRKMITPTFHFKILEQFLVIMNEQAEILCNKFATYDPNEAVDVFDPVTLATLDIICETAMGRNVEAQSKPNSPYVDAVVTTTDAIFQRMFTPWLWSDVAWAVSPIGRKMNKCLKILNGFTKQVIKERREARSSAGDVQKTQPSESDLLGKKKRTAFLDMLLDTRDANGQPLTDQDIREEVDTFMFEGHDTTASNAAFSLFVLAAFPEVQRRVRQELEDIFGSDKERPITTEDISQMKYLEACIKESQRYFPTVPFMMRQTWEETVVDGHVVPPRTNIILLMYGLHQDPKYFPNPDQYNPERFMGGEEDTANRRHPYAFCPFSAGSRNCIGQKFAMMEEKVLLASVLRRFTLSTEAKAVREDLLPELIMRRKGGIPIKIRPRTATSAA